MNPVTKISHITKFGRVDGELRGHDLTKLMDPPVEQIDNYHWLRDDTRTNQAVLAHVDNENSYTDSILVEYKNLQHQLYEEIKSHTLENYDSYAYKIDSGIYRYFKRYNSGQEYPTYWQKNTLTNTELLLLDVNLIAQNKTQCDVTSFMISPNHTYFAYGVDYDGNEKYNLVIQHILTRENIFTTIPQLVYCPYLWGNSHLIYYLVGDSTNNLRELWMYDIDTSINTQLYIEQFENYKLDIWLSNDKKYLLIRSSDYDTNFMQYIDLHNSTNKINLFHQSIGVDTKFSIDHRDGFWYIHTNLNCVNWKIMRTPCDKLSVEFWEDFIPHSDKCIESFDLFDKFIVIEAKLKDNMLVCVFDYDMQWIKIITHNSNYTINLDEFTTFSHQSNHAYTIELYEKQLYSTNTICLVYGSLKCPTKLLDYNIDTLMYSTVYENIVPNYDSELYDCIRLWAPSGDVNVPISLVYRKDLLNGYNPLYLYGYGSYGITIDPNFNCEILPLLNRGYVYAIAHIRGGS